MGLADDKPSPSSEAIVVMPYPAQPMSVLEPKLLDELDAKLRELLAEYESRLADTPAYEDLSQAVYARAANEAASALARIEGGTYGSCEECRRPIPVERLEALPHTTTCAVCAGRSPARH